MALSHPSHRTILTFLSPFPPKLAISSQKLSSKSHKSHRSPPSPPPPPPPPIKVSRRDVALLSFLALVPTLWLPAPTRAFSIGISGPKDWLKEQKKKASKFLLAPIDASREILRSAYLLLTASESDYTDKESEEVQRMLTAAARDCVPQERNSFVVFQANTGVEVCTFRLIVNNASSLLAKKDPVKLEAEAMLNDLIRSFISLNDLANGNELASNRQKLANALMDTISSLNKFEQGVKDCL